MTSDLVIALAGGGGFLKIHAAEHGVFAVFVLDSEDGLREFPAFLRIFSGSIKQRGLINRCLAGDVVIADIDAADSARGRDDALIDGGNCA